MRRRWAAAKQNAVQLAKHGPQPDPDAPSNAANLKVFFDRMERYLSMISAQIVNSRSVAPYRWYEP